MRICRAGARIRSVVAMTQTGGTERAVSFAGAVKTFGAVRAVDGVDLEIGRGETIALLGRNGAGKSTTISLLLGLNAPDAGTVELFGAAPESAVRNGLVGAMLQESRAVPRVTVGELVAFVARCYPAPLPVARALELAGIGDLAGRRVDRLSGGQTQRVRFAVALAGNPSLIVLDEPTAALDVEARHAFWQSMRAYARRGHTVLFSTHYLEEADAHADRIVVIDRGRIVADGTGEQLKRAAGGSLVSFDLAGRATGGCVCCPAYGPSKYAATAPCSAPTTRTRPCAHWRTWTRSAAWRSAPRPWTTRSSR